MMGDAVLQLDHLVIAQGDFRLIRRLAGPPAGARVALIGPSGAGKSTLLSAIAGFFRRAGRVSCGRGRILRRCRRARPLSILFQDQNLFPHLTVAQNLGLGLRPDLRLSPDERARVAAALERVGLDGLGARRPAQLSGGQMAGRRWRGCCCGPGRCCCWTNPSPRLARR
jgi:thiamine transport system ATP-binding protein